MDVGPPDKPFKFIPAGIGADLWPERNFSNLIDIAFPGISPDFDESDRGGYRLRRLTDFCYLSYNLTRQPPHITIHFNTFFPWVG